MLKYLKSKGGPRAIPLTPIGGDEFAVWLRNQPANIKAWVKSTGFEAGPGTTSLIADADGSLARVLFGLGEGGIWDWAALPGTLPRGSYRIEPEPKGDGAAGRAALGWALGTYAFRRYRKADGAFASLVWPRAADRRAVERAAEATFLVRDLINAPASDMGPAELARAARDLAARYGARVRVTAGEALLQSNYPAIYAVGRASPRGPRLIDLRWGNASAPRVTVVGKGVCFDTGGLDLKSASAMKLMKKDMGGAAHALGLASMIMAWALPVRLRVLIPAVENSVSGHALRPLDVVRTRKGLTVEIGNTDAEGRVVLADALAAAAADSPDLLVDFATLTGAARVALGTEVPALFCNDERLASGLLAHAEAEADPLWRLPLHRPYRRQIESRVADLTNAPEGGYGGAITAALFLQEFVDRETPWAHIDLMAWNTSARAGRPEGGEAMGMRAVFALIRERFSR